MFKRQKTGSVVCSSCGSLVGVNDETCYTCGRRNPGLWGFAPLLRQLGNDFGFVSFVVYSCAALYAAGLIATVALGGSVMGGGSIFGMLAPHQVVNLAFGESGAIPVFQYGMWWTILSAGWLHGGALHILFNMYMVRQLGPATADVYGTPRMVIIYTIAGAAGFLVSSTAGYYLSWMPVPFLRGAAFTVGASASILGLLGALVHNGRRGGSSFVGAQAMQYAVSILILGVIMPGVDNFAHIGGFAGGYLASAWLDPLSRERPHHLLGALLCIALSGLAIVASMLTVFPSLIRQQ
jgi:rhomboid protease GluP